MKYLIQRPISTQLSEHEGYLVRWFRFKDIEIRLIPKELNIFTKSKKIQVISEAGNYQEAQKKIDAVFHEFFDLLTFFTKERIELSIPELYLRSEPNKLQRIIIYHIYDIENNIQFWNDYQSIGMSVDWERF